MFFELFMNPLHIIATFLQDAAFWFLIAFILFVILLGRRIWAAIRLGLDKYAETIKSEITEAVRKKQVALETLAEAESQYVKAQSTAAAILEHAEFETDRIRSEMGRELERFMLSREKAVDDRIKNSEDTAIREIRDQSVRIGVRAAQMVLRKNIAPEIDARFINQAIDELEKEEKLVS